MESVGSACDKIKLSAHDAIFVIDMGAPKGNAQSSWVSASYVTLTSLPARRKSISVMVINDALRHWPNVRLYH